MTVATEPTKYVVPISKPFFGPEELAAVQQTLESGWVVQGRRVKEFEEKFCRSTGSRFSAATSSCTTALQVAVSVLNLKPGDEVIVPAFTWVATANVVEAAGGIPVFCDIDLATFNIDTKQIANLLTSQTVGVIPVHLFGLCADIDPILALARQHGLWVVEDAACALGAQYHGLSAGTFGDLGCFSFHPRKSITTGEGGMITTGREDLDQIVRSVRDHGACQTLSGRTSGSAFLLPDFDRVGFNYRMTDIQGAIGCAQMDRLDWILQRRSRSARFYDEELAGTGWLSLPYTPSGYVHGYQGYVCLFRPEVPSLSNVHSLHERRNKLMTSLQEKGIATRQGTHAPVVQGYYTKKYGLRAEQFPNAYIADRLSIALPLYPQLTEIEQRYVTETLRKEL